MLLFFLALILFHFASAQAQTGQVSGMVIDRATGQPVAACNIVVLPSRAGTTTNQHGVFELRLPLGTHTIRFQHLGYEPVSRDVTLSARHPRVEVTVEMNSRAIALQEVTVTGKREEASTSVQKLERLDIRRMPTLYSDVLRTVKILPGVSSNNELSSAYNVRGGNYDENLIYLNGYEIYRPFLLRQGVEENQSLINPDLVENIRFFAGGFPARHGDKMSSALEVNYDRNASSGLHGTVRADLFNLGLAVRNRVGKLSWTAGGRYTNPNLFLSSLQTKGNYRPYFIDGQVLLNYAFTPKANLELFVLHSYNQFDLIPDTWTGHYWFGLLDIRGIQISYQGRSEYANQTGLTGLRYRHRLGRRTQFTLSAARYETREEEDRDLYGEAFSIPDAREPNHGLDFLKTRTERAANFVNLETYEWQSTLSAALANHGLQAGITYRLLNLTSLTNEVVFEIGPESLPEAPEIEVGRQSLDFHSISGYLQDDISLGKKWQVNLGVRALHYGLTDEILISPRAGLYFYPSPAHSVNLRWGVYYQPPLFYEARLRNPETLKSQKSMHAVLGWEHRFSETMKLQVETYYKHLDRLLPFYLEQLKLVYLKQNRNEGYAYGLDLMLQGEVVKGINSWLGYSYLNTKERPIDGSADFSRRLLDQRHTLRFFLQDKHPRFSNAQAHLRILLGSGYLYHPRVPITDDETNDTYLQIEFDRSEKLQTYFRLDVGFSMRFDLAHDRDLIVIVETQNAWNVLNVLSYSWFQVEEGVVRIPQVLSRRFFNVGMEVAF